MKPEGRASLMQLSIGEDSNLMFLYLLTKSLSAGHQPYRPTAHCMTVCAWFLLFEFPSLENNHPFVFIISPFYQNSRMGGSCLDGRQLFQYIIRGSPLRHDIMTSNIKKIKTLFILRPRLHWNLWVSSDVIWNKFHASHWISVFPFFC